jgi:hypothetical protein
MPPLFGIPAGRLLKRLYFFLLIFAPKTHVAFAPSIAGRGEGRLRRFSTNIPSIKEMAPQKRINPTRIATNLATSPLLIPKIKTRTRI